jgi:hypothetical protein
VAHVVVAVAAFATQAAGQRREDAGACKRPTSRRWRTSSRQWLYVGATGGVHQSILRELCDVGEVLSGVGKALDGFRFDRGGGIGILQTHQAGSGDDLDRLRGRRQRQSEVDGGRLADGEISESSAKSERSGRNRASVSMKQDRRCEEA